MKRGEQIRNLGLAVTLFSTVLVLAKAGLTPSEQPKPITYTFPEQIPLTNWQFDRSDSTSVQRSRGPALVTSVDDLAISGQTYRYLRNGQQLDIEMRYFNDTYLDVTAILRDSNLQRVKPEMVEQQSAQGSYVLFTKSGIQYLSACISPVSRTTVSEGDFRREQNRPDVLANRFLPWLLGVAPLRDLRCVWTKMSIRPVNASEMRTPSPNTSVLPNQQQELEQVWQQWSQWWKQHYPPEASKS